METSQATELVYNKLVHSITSDGQQINVNPINILPTVVKSVSLVEKYYKGDGSEKKKIVYSVIDKLLENQNVSNKDMVVSFLATSLSTLIDTTVSVFNGEMTFKYKRRFLDFFPCFRQKSS